ncbi:hypothetical protein [Labrenzia sp. VG12]|uniref:capsular polysaccharide export protein, LipB/KpsS family n=1 Tax=Labrenzia sp. VG12 TaxID=2021862 RepID=UPI0012FDF031|nr:hypothetical protein [Labrenzia sp. VG12]
MIRQPTGGHHYLVIGASTLMAAGPRPGNGDTIPLLILDGPSPVDAKRVPASFVAMPVPLPQTADCLGPEEVARWLVQSAKERPAGTDTDFAGLWRTRDMNCAASGEQVPGEASSNSLERLLTGHPDMSSMDPFWGAVHRQCETQALDQTRLVNHILSKHTLWFSPYNGEPILPADAAAIFAIMHEHWQENDQPAHCFGAQYWNHPSIRATFSGRGGSVQFHETEAETLAAASASRGRVLSWAGRTSRELEAECSKTGTPLLRIEDGFLRSVGLGAGLARGAMLAVDDLGIYYDPSRPSRLEVLLRDRDLLPDERKRGEYLVDRLQRARVSKYNFGKSRTYDFPTGRKKILVPGQVADDAAIRKSRSATIDCANTPNVNLDLLRLARERHPDAFLVFKPHPDVETGLRKGKVARETALGFVDAVAEDANIIDLIEAVDAVETFSSLSGYEALLRGKSVAVHGAPFYAGWGLCEDLTPLEGRGRRRSLAELVYLSLVVYARTIDPVTLLPCTPEFLISRLTEQRNDRKHLLVTAAKRHASWLGRKLGL